jgi:hypothetical protein
MTFEVKNIVSNLSPIFPQNINKTSLRVRYIAPCHACKANVVVNTIEISINKLEVLGITPGQK